VQATEEPDDCTEDAVHSVVCLPFQTLPQLHVGVLSHVSGRVDLLIHEVHESIVACLLEHHLVGETVGHHAVHFFFELQHLFYECDGIFDVFLVLDDARSAFSNVRGHLVNHLVESCFVVSEHLEQELKLLQLAVFEEVVDASFLFDDGLCHICNYFLDRDGHTLLLCGHIKPEVTIFLLLQEGLVGIVEVLEAVTRNVPLLSIGVEELLGQLEERRFELSLVVAEVCFSFPEETVVLTRREAFAIFTQVSVNLNYVSNYFACDGLIFAVTRDLP
jgi:hypothetical protein